MAATWNLQSQSVGPRLGSTMRDVKTPHDLLPAIGYDSGSDSGTWDERAEDNSLTVSGERGLTRERAGDARGGM